MQVLLKMDFVRSSALDMGLEEGEFGKGGVAFNKFVGFGAGSFDHLDVFDGFHAEVGESPLFGTA